ncbi:MAG: glycyl-radical enzyme activating protein [Oscillospiraceae bacterium]|nr:glycyl-radical enzyme activating protein [Oscillospiraceae bacterium]
MYNIKNNENKSGRIFNIQRFSVFDGPGIRTVVFFSGCNLKCLWCHNPESISSKQQLKFNCENCILCGKCFDVCENKTHELIDGAHIIDRSKCKVCLKCTKECYAEALVPVYCEMTVSELEKSILTDEEYYKRSNGGVTFSGGEPMLQVDFLCEILKACKNHGIHTAVDTAGAVGFEAFEKILPYCDLFLYDIKAYNSEVHKKLTGISNGLILENLTRLSKLAAVWVRVPVIPDVNTDEMVDIAEFMSEINITKCELLAYHKLGEGKYKSLGIEDVHVFTTPDDNVMNEIKNLFKAKNINVE